jgi:hypothetical protein
MAIGTARRGEADEAATAVVSVVEAAVMVVWLSCSPVYNGRAAEKTTNAASQLFLSVSLFPAVTSVNLAQCLMSIRSC